MRMEAAASRKPHCKSGRAIGEEETRVLCIAERKSRLFGLCCCVGGESGKSIEAVTRGNVLCRRKAHKIEFEADQLVRGQCRKCQETSWIIGSAQGELLLQRWRSQTWSPSPENQTMMWECSITRGNGGAGITSRSSRRIPDRPVDSFMFEPPLFNRRRRSAVPPQQATQLSGHVPGVQSAR